MTFRIALPFPLRRKAIAAPVDDAAPTPDAAAAVGPTFPRPRVGLWVLTAFVAIAALVVMSALVMGPHDATLIVLVPVAIFWTVVVCAAFAVRAALINVTRAAALRKADKPDVADVRLSRMVQAERRREARKSSPKRVLHAV